MSFDAGWTMRIPSPHQATYIFPIKAFNFTPVLYAFIEKNAVHINGFRVDWWTLFWATELEVAPPISPFLATEVVTIDPVAERVAVEAGLRVRHEFPPITSLNQFVDYIKEDVCFKYYNGICPFAPPPEPPPKDLIDLLDEYNRGITVWMGRDWDEIKRKIIEVEPGIYARELYAYGREDIRWYF